MKPKISIITITYNSEKTLESTIQSVINQGYENLEYLIIDGGSKDHTLDIVNKYRNHISYFVSEPDEGISDAFNKGIIAATGEIIGIINSDDLLLPGALDRLSKEYDPKIDVYLGNIEMFNTETNIRLISKPSTEYPLNGKNITVCHPATFMNKNAYNKFGLYRVDFKSMMDQDILTRMYLRGALFKRIDSELAQFTSGGVTDRITLSTDFTEYKKYLRFNGAESGQYYWLLFLCAFRRYTKYLLVKLGIFKFLRELRYKRK